MSPGTNKGRSKTGHRNLYEIADTTRESSRDHAPRTRLDWRTPVNSHNLGRAANSRFGEFKRCMASQGSPEAIHPGHRPEQIQLYGGSVLSALAQTHALPSSGSGLRPGVTRWGLEGVATGNALANANLLNGL